jgi:hypothetical protein
MHRGTYPAICLVCLPVAVVGFALGRWDPRLGLVVICAEVVACASVRLWARERRGRR